MRGPIKWRRQYAEPERDAALAVFSAQAAGPEPDLTVQSFRDDADLNVLLRRFGVARELPRPDVRPFYGDFSSAPDYQTALNMIQEADSAFAGLPAAVRARFRNNPGELVAFLQDERNLDEAVDLGLAVAKPAPPPVEASEGKPEPKKKAAKQPADGDAE